MSRFNHFYKVDERRNFVLLESKAKAVEFMAEHFIACAKEAILNRGQFFVALSGGSTPKAIYKELALHHQKSLDWTKVHCFFSDERAVEKEDPDSNYHSAMTSGLQELPILKNHIYRMKAETAIEKEALAYENLIESIVKDSTFDLVMLGMGEDGHTASLFPHSDGLKVDSRLVIANFIPSKNCMRMTFTFKLINQAKLACFYVLGASKASMCQKVLTPHLKTLDYPATLVGTPSHAALWILDKEAKTTL